MHFHWARLASPDVIGPKRETRLKQKINRLTRQRGEIKTQAKRRAPRNRRFHPSLASTSRNGKKGKGAPYQIGGQKMPGVCLLPGPEAKRDWPPKNKYKDAEKVHGMCQLCSTICGITGYVKDGRLLKIEGNPNDPNSRGKLCARGHAGLNHLYHPERLLYPLKRVGARGEGKWKRISWDEALDEIAEKLKGIRDRGETRRICLSSRATA